MFVSLHRRILLACALILFAAGLTVSVRNLDIRLSELALFPLLVNVVLVAPFALILNAWALQLSACVLGLRIDFGIALSTSSVAGAAEVLPLPAGVMARSAALLAAGASPRDTALVLSVNGVLWFGLSSLAGCMALSTFNLAAGGILFAIGTAATGAALLWLGKRATAGWVITVLLHRCLSVVVVVLRIMLAFAVLRTAITPLDAALLASANAVGSYSSIVPAGLGVGEALAALAAMAISLSASMAFAAVAMNRVIAIAVAGLFALLTGTNLLTALERREAREKAHRTP